MMKKLLIPYILGTTATICCSIPKTQVVFANENITESAKSAYCMDAESKSEVYGKNEEERLPIASMCKIMTLLLCFDGINDGKLTYDTMIPVSEHAKSMGGSQVYLDSGVSYKAEELIKSIIVCSANDSCVAMAEYLYGSTQSFVDKMNERAEKLGCRNTLFANCTGLPKEPQYSCAKDVALMFRELIKNDKFFEFSAIRTENFKHPSGRETLITNTNKLVRQYTGCDGGKTGFTNQAGFCLAATAKQNGMRVISVCIGASTGKDRFNCVSNLFDYAFSKFEKKELFSSSKPFTQEITISDSKQKYYKTNLSENVSFFNEKGKSLPNITHSVNYYSVKAPVKAGTQVGELTVYVDGKEYGKYPLTLANDALKATYGDYLSEISSNW